MTPLSRLNPAACLPCVRPAAPDKAPAGGFAASLGHVENTTRRSAMSNFRHAIAMFGGHVRQTFIRLVNPVKGHGAQAPVRQDRNAERDADPAGNAGNALSLASYPISLESLRGLVWTDTIKVIDALELQLQQPRSVSPARFQSTFSRLVCSLKLFAAAGVEGMGLSDDGRKTFAALRDASVVRALSANRLEILGDMPDISRYPRHQLMGFLDQVKGALVKHAANVESDARRGVLWTIPAIRGPRGAWAGTRA